jgi:hypothetical protein
MQAALRSRWPTATCGRCGETTAIHQTICMWCGGPWGGQAEKPPLVGGGVRRFLVALTCLLLVFAALEAFFVLSAALSRPFGVTLGMDYAIYHERATSWLAGSGFYQPYQLAGPYEVGVVSPPPALYPPPMASLALLPPILWWGIPLAVIAWNLRRAPWWAWPILALVLVYPRTWIVLVYGNPSMWALAALTTAWRPLALIKPTLAPFALTRDWRPWVAAICLAIPFGAMWLDYATAIRNASNGYGLDYLLGEWPIALALMTASSARWRARGPAATRSRSPRAVPSTHPL